MIGLRSKASETLELSLCPGPFQEIMAAIVEVPSLPEYQYTKRLMEMGKTFLHVV